MAGVDDQAVLERLRTDTPFYAEHCLKIVDPDSELVPFVYRTGQLKLDRALEAQRRAGKPMRGILLKSRRFGGSTSVQAKLHQRTTTRANRRGLTVAQDNDTAGELFDIGKVFNDELPADLPIELRPRRTRTRNSIGGQAMLQFGDINSQLKIDTAKEVNAGRGKTITDLHCSEVAFWPDPRKALSLLNAVMDRPETLVVLESTANGHNFFKQRWHRAEQGLGGYVAVFVGWPEDENCTLAFADQDEAERFRREEVGRGEYGIDEARLLTRGCTLEQLHWRRQTIVDKADGSLALFKQEYPSTPMEAFVGSGKHVFSIVFIEDAEQEARSAPEPEEGLFVAKDYAQRHFMTGTIDVPTGALWVPASATDLASGKDYWKLWERPPDLKALRRLRDENEIDEAEYRERLEGRPAELNEAQYVVVLDPAAGEEATSGGDSDWHAIQVIDHHTLRQVAEWRSRCDRDLAPLEALLGALFFNTALVAVETTGGYGLGPVDWLWKRAGYKRLFRRRAVGQMQDKRQRLLGWDTNRRTKPAMEDTMAELLREGAKDGNEIGIRSIDLVGELKTYVKRPDGKHGADEDAHDDLLLAFMVAQRVAQLERPRILASGAGKTYSSLPGVR